MKLPTMWSLVRQVTECQPPFSLLPASALRLVYKALVVGGSGLEKQTEDEYWTMVRWLCVGNHSIRSLDNI